MKKIIKLIFRQYNTGPFLGRLLMIYATAMGFYGMLGQAIGLSTWYTVRGNTLLPWAGFWSLLAVAILLGLCLCLVSWKFVIPSQINISNRQGWEHNNPGRPYMERMDKRIENIEKLLEKVLESKASK